MRICSYKDGRSENESNQVVILAANSGLRNRWAQRRWVFKCDDPKILREIDSVFVTFGRPDGDSLHPEGSSLMYAYLRGQPNHP
jgi:hypothetical protein